MHYRTIRRALEEAAMPTGPLVVCHAGLSPVASAPCRFCGRTGTEPGVGAGTALAGGDLRHVLAERQRAESRLSSDRKAASRRNASHNSTDYVLPDSSVIALNLIIRLRHVLAVFTFYYVFLRFHV